MCVCVCMCVCVRERKREREKERERDHVLDAVLRRFRCEQVRAVILLVVQSII